MAITFVGAGAQEAGTGTTLTPALPTHQEGDLLLAIVFSRGEGGNISGNESSVDFTFPQGWARLPGHETAFRHANSTADLTLECWYKFAGASESDPGIDCDTASQGWCAQVAAYRGVDQADIADVDAVGENFAGLTPNVTPASVTTQTDGAWVISVCAINNDGQLTIAGADQGFTERMGGSDYDSNVGADMAVGLADREAATAGSVTMPTWDQATGGDPSWVTMSFALKPGSTTQNVAVGQAFESDSAQTLGRRKNRALGQAAESDAAQAVARRKAKALGQAAEADATQAIGRRKALALGQATESDTAFAITRGQNVTGVAVGRAAEADAALAVTPARRYGLEPAAESSAAQAIAVRKTLAVGQAIETEAAQAIGPAKHKAIGQAAEADSAQAVTAIQAKVAAVGTALEDDSAGTITWAPKHRMVRGAVELNIAQPIEARVLREGTQLGSRLRGRQAPEVDPYEIHKKYEELEEALRERDSPRRDEPTLRPKRGVRRSISTPIEHDAAASLTPEEEAEEAEILTLMAAVALLSE